MKTMQKYMEVHFADEESKKSEASTKDESSSESENDEDEIEGVSLTINFDLGHSTWLDILVW